MSDPRVFHPRPTGAASPPPPTAPTAEEPPASPTSSRPAPAQPAAPSASPGFLRPMTRILRMGGLGSALALPLFTLLGWLVAGVPGAWGALIGVGLAVLFFGITVLLAVLTARLGPTEFAVATLGGWLAKLVLLFVVLALLRDADFYSRPVLFVSLLLGTAGVLVLEAMVVSKTRVPYTEPVVGR